MKKEKNLVLTVIGEWVVGGPGTQEFILLHI